MEAMFHKTKNSKGNTILILSSLIISVLILLRSEIASRTALSAIILCGKTLIPTIFPFLIISGILVKCGFAEYIGRIIGKPFSSLFGIGRACSASLITGLICGFPAGASSAYNIFDMGLCDDDSLQQSVLVSSMAAPGFVILAIGGEILGDIRRGVILWLIQCLAVMLSAFIFARIIKKKNSTYFGTVYHPSVKPKSPLICLSESVKEASLSMISICGAVVFFSVPAGLIASLGFIPETIKCLISSFFELTSGAALTGNLIFGDMELVILSAGIGWSGLSVHSQIASVTGGKLNTFRFAAGKILSSVFSAAITLAAIMTGVL